MNDLLELNVLVVHAAEHPDDWVEEVYPSAGSSDIGRWEVVSEGFHSRQLVRGEGAVWGQYLVPLKVSDSHVVEKGSRG